MGEKTFVNCTGGGPIRVHVEGGKITKVRPLVFDETDAPSWVIEANGKKYSPQRKACVAPFTLTERARVYSEDRIMYPMKRVDFDPKGAPGSTGPGGRNAQNRGKSAYQRISWKEAFELVSSEMIRIREKYGPEAITSRASSHHNWGNVGYRTGAWSRFFSLIGFTDILDNPDSWEGWHWGATHTFGFYWRLGNPEHYDMLEDNLKNTELIIHWGNDVDTTHGIYGGNESAQWRLWFRDKGVRQIFLDPYFNYTAAHVGDKWISYRPGTTSALAAAIANVWITEGTYDKEYVARKTLGFDEFKAYILGETDGVPKTPQWGEEVTGVPARTIVALAGEWASHRTTLAGGTKGGEGGYCRQAYATEHARMLVLLQAMQGLGKPGVSIWGTANGPPYNHTLDFPGYASGGNFNLMAEKPVTNPVAQRLYRLTAPEAILNGKDAWTGQPFCGGSLDAQFIKWEYPLPGNSQVKMFYRYGGAFLSTMVDTNKWVRMYQSPNLEFVVNQDCWFSTETRLADVILPACTNLERDDISEYASSGGYSLHASGSANHRIIIYQQKCVEPVGESKSDYDIFCGLAEKLGVLQEYTEGNTWDQWIEKMFYKSDLPKYVMFEEFKKKGYFVVPQLPDYKPTPALRWFYEDRTCDTPDSSNPKRHTDKGAELGTYSGKIEFASESLKANLPDDLERPIVPKYIPSWEGHESEAFKQFPIALISPHPRFTFHTHHDHHVPWLSEIPGHRMDNGGYKYWVARVHPSDAEPRGIKHGDVIELFNDRASVLCVAHVTERVRPGVVHSYEGAASYDPIEPGKAGTTDKGGCVNMLTPSRMVSQNVPGMAPNSCLIEFRKWEA
jgi:trimethylamine-N-oxide reductase (cytochrome c)